MRKPDAGNPHVRFEEGEGTRRSLAWPLTPCVPLYSTAIRVFNFKPKFCRAHLALDVYVSRFAPVIRIKEKAVAALTQNR